jgi:hypothetical protein
MSVFTIEPESFSGLVRATPATTAESQGQQLTELPPLDTTGLNLLDYAVYVRKLTSGGPQDFQATLAAVMAQLQIFVATNKSQMRSFTPSAPYQICLCLGGNVPNDNQGGIYFTTTSTDQDNGGDRIRPNTFTGLVWYKWLI